MNVSAEPAGEVVRIDALLYLELVKKRRGEVIQWQHSLITVFAHNSQQCTVPVPGVGACDLFAPQAKGGAQGEHGTLGEGAGAECTEHDCLGDGPRDGARNPHCRKRQGRIVVQETTRMSPRVEDSQRSRAALSILGPPRCAGRT